MPNVDLNPIGAAMAKTPDRLRMDASPVLNYLGKSNQPVFVAVGPVRDSVRTPMFLNAKSDGCLGFSLSTGLVLGNERFRNEVEQLTGQRQRLEKRGPKPA